MAVGGELVLSAPATDEDDMVFLVFTGSRRWKCLLKSSRWSGERFGETG